MTLCVPCRSNPNHKELSRSCCGALRQLANSDGVKKLIASSGGITLVLDSLALHDGAEDLAEGGLGLLANICLRLPEVGPDSETFNEGAADQCIYFCHQSLLGQFRTFSPILLCGSFPFVGKFRTRTSGRHHLSLS